MQLTSVQIEFSTPLSENTHQLKDIVLWLILDCRWIAVTRNYSKDSLVKDPTLVNMDDFEVAGLEPQLTTHKLLNIKKLIAKNKTLLEQYISEDSGIEELIQKFEL